VSDFTASREPLVYRGLTRAAPASRCRACRGRRPSRSPSF